MQFNVGDTFINKPTRDLPDHLWVIIAISIDGSLAEAAIVNFTSDLKYRDENCLIAPGEHPFAKEMAATKVENGSSELRF